MKRFIAILSTLIFTSSGAFAAAGHAAFVATAKRTISAGLKDPDSAKFRNLAVYRPATGKGLALCGEINAKNMYGAYVGFRPFFSLDGGLSEVAELDGSGLYSTLSESLCAKKLGDVN